MPKCWRCDGAGGRHVVVTMRQPMTGETASVLANWWAECSVCGGVGILFADTEAGRAAIAANPARKEAPDADAR
jgi:hypothetical protein